MSTVLPLEKMSIDEKLRALEELTIDLAKREQELPVPQWHLDLLRRREELVQEGKAQYVSLDTFKQMVAEDIARGRPKNGDGPSS